MIYNISYIVILQRNKCVVGEPQPFQPVESTQTKQTSEIAFQPRIHRINMNNEFSVADRGESLVDQVYRQLAAGLLEGRYSPGQRINMRALAAAMEVSQTPVREALTRLLSEKVLVMSGRAIEVPLIEQAHFEEIFRLRLLLEGDLAERAAPLLTPAILTEQERTQEEFDQAIERQDFKLGLKLNVQFHFAIYHAALQPISVQLIERLWLLVGPSMNLMYPALATTRSVRHASILDAMRSGSPQQLRRAVEYDIQTAREKILALLPAMQERLATKMASPPVVRRPVGRPRKDSGIGQA